MCLKSKVIIDVLQVERVAENSGRPKLVVLNLVLGGRLKTHHQEIGKYYEMLHRLADLDGRNT
jgi:hypothetical protein